MEYLKTIITLRNATLKYFIIMLYIKNMLILDISY